MIIAPSQWGAAHLFEPAEPFSRPVDACDRVPLPMMRVPTSDGREIGPADIESVVR